MKEWIEWNEWKGPAFVDVSLTGFVSPKLIQAADSDYVIAR